MKRRVIVQFGSFEQRDRWLSLAPEQSCRVYKRNPWLATELSDEQLEELERQADVEIHPDVQMSPFAASTSTSK